MFKIKNVLLFILCFFLITCQERHKVEDLFNGLYDKDIYSGYLKTDIEGNELFYVFTPSQSSPSKDPLFLWLNGGPGCSSLFGFLGEIGPVTSVPFENRFQLNEYSWNLNANLLFIESPGGVGFSKITNPDFFFNDTITAIGLNVALQNFFAIFTEYQSNDFYITGESYAGTYIPHLVKQIKNISKSEINAIEINLKGFIIGNPYTAEETDYEDSMVEFGFAHGLIEYNTFKNYLNHCPHLPQKERFIEEYYEYDYNYKKNLKEEEDIYPIKFVTHKCNQIRKEIGRQFEGINFYGIYNKCPPYEYFENKYKYKNIDYKDNYIHSFKYNYLKMIRQYNYENYLKKIKSNLKNFNNKKNLNSKLEPAIDFFPGCGDDIFVDEFLNDNNTKRKLGVDENIHYYQCAGLNYQWGESLDFYRENLEQLTKEGFKAWLFSGTEDIAVATLGTLRWINYSNYTVEKKWKQWYVDGQVAGMEQKYTSGLNIVTVKGCGHMVPQDNPKVAKKLLDKFIESDY